MADPMSETLAMAQALHDAHIECEGPDATACDPSGDERNNWHDSDARALAARGVRVGDEGLRAALWEAAVEAHRPHARHAWSPPEQCETEPCRTLALLFDSVATPTPPEIDVDRLREIVNQLGDSTTGNESLVIEAHRLINRLTP